MMNKNNRTIVRFSVFSGILLAVVAALTVVSQTGQNGGRSLRNVIINNKPTPAGAENSNKIIAVRRINVVTEATGTDGLPAMKKIPYVEIELNVGSADTGTNLMHVVRIGDVDFIVHDWTSSGSAILLLSPGDFKELKEESEVSYRVGVAEEKEKLKRASADGLTVPALGKRLGRLDKSLIDRQLTIDRQLNEKL